MFSFFINSDLMASLPSPLAYNQAFPLVDVVIQVIATGGFIGDDGVLCELEEIDKSSLGHWSQSNGLYSRPFGTKPLVSRFKLRLEFHIVNNTLNISSLSLSRICQRSSRFRAMPSNFRRCRVHLQNLPDVEPKEQHPQEEISVGTSKRFQVVYNWREALYEQLDIFSFCLHSSLITISRGNFVQTVPLSCFYWVI